MGTLLLMILKWIGIALLCIFILLLVLLLLVLFVPIHYGIRGNRKTEDEAPVHVTAKVTWLLHLISVRFSYPEAAFLKIRVLGIPVYDQSRSTHKKTEQTWKSNRSRNREEGEADVPEQKPEGSTAAKTENSTAAKPENNATDKQESGTADNKQESNTANIPEHAAADKQESTKEEEPRPSLLRFFKKLFHMLTNIKYTIQKICDKIKKIIRDIRYYTAILKSESFQRAFDLCREEIITLLRQVLPRKIKGDFVVGTGDPAGTAQILAVHGMLYPLIGNHITVTPDFENAVIEGTFLIKGHVTVFVLLRTAIRVYFSKDIRHVIRLFKREAA